MTIARIYTPWFPEGTTTERSQQLNDLTNIIVMVPALTAGSHIAVVTVDPDGDGETTSCGTTTFTFNTNQDNGGPP